MYAPLWCKSNFSFLEGASHPDELVEEAHRLGLPAIAITDRDGVCGVVRAHLRARELGVDLLIGSEVTVDDGTTVVLLAADRAGWTNLCRLITGGRLSSPRGSPRVTRRRICLHADGLIALWGGRRSLIVSGGDREADAAAGDLASAFGDRLYALAARHLDAEEVREEEILRRRAARHGLPLVAASEVLYHTRARRPLQDVLTCIRHGVTLSEAGRRTRPNDEHYLRSPRQMAALFADDPEAVARTGEVASRCRFSLDQLRYRYPSTDLPDGTTSSERLRRLALDGARRRYRGSPPAAVLEQLDRELSLIDELDYPGYFLTMWEVVDFCRERGILCQGRGSAANSAVCYCLGITAIDPVRMGLLFERFVSRERAEPPDIDLDIEHARREEVIQHVYAERGRDRAAMAAAVIRYRPKSAVRDVGKALGLPRGAIDRLARLLSRYDHIPEEKLAMAGLDPEAAGGAQLLWLSREIQDFPRHLSIHPGGFLLGSEPVHDLVPIERAAMAGRTVIQWDKDDIEALGLFKVDLLGLGALTQLRLCFELLEESRGISLSMASIPADDPGTFEMIRRGDTVGVFQIESRAQTSMLPRLGPRDFYDLVIEVSIVRPGPITGGMVHPYLRRRRGEEPVDYPHPSLEPVLRKTLGVPLFQEQVMRLAMAAADYSPGEADQLRRDMAAWRRSGRIERHRERLVSRMIGKGIAREFAERVFDQIRGFGKYGFPESHAASFALISYAAAYLKRHYPAEFTCALLNAQPMGFYTPATIVEDARRHGVEVLPVDVARSGWGCAIEAALPAEVGSGPAVRMGLRFVKGLGRADLERIRVARERRPFSSLSDLAARTRLPADRLLRLAEAGALSSLCESRRRAMWELRALARRRDDSLLLEPSEPLVRLPGLSAFDAIAWDYVHCGHSTRGHPLGPLRPRLRALGLPDARGIAAARDGSRVRYAGMVICRQRPSTASGVTFATLEDETGFVNLVLWRDVFARREAIARTSAFLGVTGRIQATDGVVHLIAEDLWVPPLDLRPESAGSRDFR